MNKTTGKTGELIYKYSSYEFNFDCNAQYACIIVKIAEKHF